MKKHLRIVAVLLLAVVMMVGMTFVSSAGSDDAVAVASSSNEFMTAEDLTPGRIILLVVAIASLVVALCVKPIDRWRTKDEEELDEEPIEEAIEEPIAEVAEKSVEEAPAEEPAEELAAEVLEETVEETAEEPVVELVEESAEELIEEPAVEVVEELVVEETVEETLIDETLIEETPIEETPIEEAPVEEAPVEEAPAEEPVAEEEQVAANNPLSDGQVIMVSYRSSFMSRLIQAETDIQDYYTVIKNTLLSYKGVKARTSWNYESFNIGRLQCAKINIKGRTLLLYLALNPADYNESKYHFTDASGKGKFDMVPMLLKVRSDRALKYAIELIEELMRVQGIEAGPAQNVDYHMPYETNEALAERDLVKVIIPEGVVVSENDSFVSFDVSDIIGASNSDEKSELVEESSDAVVEESAASEEVVLPEEEIIPEEVVLNEDVVVLPEEEIVPEEVVLVSEEPKEEAIVLPEEEIVSEEVVLVSEEPEEEAIVLPEEEIVPEDALVLEEEIILEEPVLEETPVVEEEAIVFPEEEIVPEDALVAEEEIISEDPVVEEAPAAEEEAIVLPEEEIVPEEPAVEAEPVVEEPIHIIDEQTQIEIEDNLAHLREAIPDEAVVHVDAQHADELISDAEATAQIEVIEAPEAERKLKGTKLCEINIDTICENFEEGETVELAKLIDRGLASKSAGKVKVLARGVMTKRLVVIADKYSIQAVKMITLAGGHAEQIGK